MEAVFLQLSILCGGFIVTFSSLYSFCESDLLQGGFVHKENRNSVFSVVGGSLHGPSRGAFAGHYCFHASLCRPASSWPRPLPVPPGTSLDQVLAHWHDSLLDVLGEDLLASIPGMLV